MQTELMPGPPGVSGRVASLHLHPGTRGAAMESVSAMELVEGRGILDNLRYFGRRNRSTGQPTTRQVSLITREELAGHAAALGLPTIAPGSVRANIETEGVDLVALLGYPVQIGEAILNLVEARTPCAKMDAVCPGLRARMTGNRQGVLAQVIRSGRIEIGSSVVVLQKNRSGWLGSGVAIP